MLEQVSGPAHAGSDSTAAGKWPLIIGAGLASFLVYTDFFAVQVALPDMAQDLDTTVVDLQWVISGYMLSLASFLIVAGRLADILGRKTWLLLGVGLFATASLLGGASVSAEMIIGMRLIQGIGAAIIMPVSMAIVTNAFPAKQVQRAVGYVLAIAAVGQASGPLLGGVFTEYLSWRWVLWVNVPVSAVAALLIAVSVKQSYDESVGRRIDWVGLVAIVASVGVFTYGIDGAAEWGWLDPRTLGCVGAGLIALAAFIHRENRTSTPLLDLSLFRNREFSAMTLAGAAGNMALTVALFLSVVLLQTVDGYSPVESAYLLLALSLGLTVSAQLAGRMERFDSRLVMSLSLVLGGAGVVGMGLLDRSIPTFLVVSVAAGLGTGMAWNFASVVTQSIVDPAKAGSASGAVLTILIGLGGVATAAAASITASTTVASDVSTAASRVLIGFGTFALLSAIPVLLWGRGRSNASTEPPPRPHRHDA